MNPKPVIAVTLGDPAGIGPEVAVAAALQPQVRAVCQPVLFGSPEVAAKALRLVAPHTSVTVQLYAGQTADTEHLLVHAIDCPGSIKPGEVSAAAGKAAALAVETAVQQCLGGKAAAIATAPLHKEALHAAGYRYPGHTEMIADLCGVRQVAMLLCGDKLRVVHATTHVALADAVTMITPERVMRSIEMLAAFLEKLGATQAPIAVAGLNPHAGEGGLFGSTERSMIVPAIQEARQRGWQVEGPFAPDTVFRRAYLGEFAGVVAMYHDQGHIAMKMVEFDTAVNTTLGLPIIRTSADHGTAFDIAWQGKANPTSMQRSILLAARLASHRFH